MKPGKNLKYFNFDPKGKSKEELIKSQSEPHSKAGSKEWYKNYNKTFKKEKNKITEDLENKGIIKYRRIG